MTDTERRVAAKKFVKDWKDADYEMGQSQDFWRDLVSRVYGESDIGFIEFEKRVKVDGTIHRIDAFIKSTRVLIEQKSGDVNLLAPQARENNKTPYEQALNYIKGLSVDLSPRWIITCNFKEFYIYDMSKAEGERTPTHIFLKDLADQYKCLLILVDEKNRDAEKEFDLSWKAGKLVGELYNELLQRYPCPESDKTKKALNILCVRLVFCLYAEDAGLFNEYHQFKSFIKSVPANYLHLALKELFTALNTPIDARENVSSTVAAFPYVNGGLFEADIEIPVFNDKTVEILLEHAEFDWSKISPTIFGALFESTLNPETRRSGGMHYTPTETIHKVIDPLFLNDLKAELDQILSIKELNKRNRLLQIYRRRLAELTFLDPACGSGNFLTETYISLRRLENIALAKWLAGKSIIDNNDIIKVNIRQFYGIEINDFAVTVAKTALWIAESQMMKETEELVIAPLDFLPLKNYSNIVEGNALRLNWENLIPHDKLTYIIGNPPFKGKKYQTKEQKEDLKLVFEKRKIKTGNLDYVTGWYQKALEHMSNTNILAAFVSTNSILFKANISHCSGNHYMTISVSIFSLRIKLLRGKARHRKRLLYIVL